MSSRITCDNHDSDDRLGTIHLLHDEPTFSDPLSHDIPLEDKPLDRFFTCTEEKVTQILLLLAELRGALPSRRDSEDQPRNAWRDHWDDSLSRGSFHD